MSKRLNGKIALVTGSDSGIGQGNLIEFAGEGADVVVTYHDEAGAQEPGMADGVSGRGVPIERFDPPEELIEDARRLLAAAGADLGGVEYLVSADDGLPYMYGVNALSNFVADAPSVVGFDPFADLVDLIVRRAADASGEDDLSLQPTVASST